MSGDGVPFLSVGGGGKGVKFDGADFFEDADNGDAVWRAADDAYKELWALVAVEPFDATYSITRHTRKIAKFGGGFANILSGSAPRIIKHLSKIETSGTTGNTLRCQLYVRLIGDIIDEARMYCAELKLGHDVFDEDFPPSGGKILHFAVVSKNQQGEELTFTSKVESGKGRAVAQPGFKIVRERWLTRRQSDGSLLKYRDLEVAGAAGPVNYSTDETLSIGAASFEDSLDTQGLVDMLPLAND